MKTKGITIWERHVEHMVLGLAVLVAAGFVAVQFIGNPNAVQDPRGNLVRPSEVDEQLQTKAEGLSRKLAPDAPSPMAVPAPEPLLPKFTAALSDSVSANDELWVAMDRHRVDPGKTDEQQRDKPIHEPVIAAPYLMATNQHFDALLPEVVAAHAELRERFPDGPYDVTWVTPSAVFSLQQVREEFQKDDPQNAVQAVPKAWYGGQVSLFDVVVEREERVEGAWTNRTTLEPAPGRFSLRPELAGRVDARGRDRMLEMLAEPGNQEQIVQPDFFATVQDSWVPPDPRADAPPEAVADENAAQLRQLRITMSQLARKRDQLNRRIEDECGGRAAGGAEGGGGRQPPGPGGGGGMGGGGRRPPGPGGGGMGAGPGSGRRPAGGGVDAAQTCDRLRRNLQRLEENISRTQKRIEEIDPAAAQLMEEAANEQRLTEADELVVWTHDLGIRTGGTYRYRFRVEIYNPFFARKPLLLEEQHALADRITLSSRTSEWTTAIEVGPPLKFFITSASPPDPEHTGRLGRNLGSATAEVFRFFDGRWWMDKFRVEPGERIGAATDQAQRGAANRLMIDFGTDWFALDVVADADQQRGPALVKLQNLRTGELSAYRDPSLEKRDPERQRLLSLVELAESEQVALASP